MNHRSLAWAAGILLVAVGMGAFGAHGMEPRLDPRAYQNWNTAAQYQFYHGLALLGLSAVQGRLASRTIAWVRTLFVMGVFCFSGSLYLLASREILGIESAVRVLGPITPLGGLLFMAGWAALLIAALRKEWNGVDPGAGRD